jgi:hypothetical protein
MKKEMRGGLRDNSATMHKLRKVRDYACTWCGQTFKSNSNGQSTVHGDDRYCSNNHRQKMFLLKSSLQNKSRVTKKDRKRHTFRPEVWRA